ncbi:hypothetical protein T439DRAFT_247115 [Meredithblackwellia eburnea MCA 4105]
MSSRRSASPGPSSRAVDRDRDDHRRRSRSPRRGDDRDRDHRRSHRSRSRSRSPSRKSSSSKHHRKREERERERDDEGGSGGSDSEEAGPPPGVKELDADDFFLKSTELKVWLDEERGKKLDQISASDARKYFKKFCRRWNKGKLEEKYYTGISSARVSSSVSSGHSWSFTKATQRELDDASRIRKEIDGPSSSRDGPRGGGGGGNAKVQGPVQGPSLPPTSGSAVQDLYNSRENYRAGQESLRDAEKAQRRREGRDAREEERDSRATGRDRVMEKRREVNAGNKAMRDAKEGGGMMEFDDETLMGGSGSSFAAAIAARDRSKTQGRRAQALEERAAEREDKYKQLRTKEDDTMAMFRKLAQERFGGGAGL